MIEMHVKLYKPYIVGVVFVYYFSVFTTDEPNNMQGPDAILHRVCGV